MQLDPEISRILAHSRIESELLYVWRSFREKTGPKLRNRFMRYVQLANQAAISTGELNFNIFHILPVRDMNKIFKTYFHIEGKSVWRLVTAEDSDQDYASIKCQETYRHPTIRGFPLNPPELLCSSSTKDAWTDTVSRSISPHHLVISLKLKLTTLGLKCSRIDNRQGSDADLSLNLRHVYIFVHGSVCIFVCNIIKEKIEKERGLDGKKADRSKGGRKRDL